MIYVGWMDGWEGMDGLDGLDGWMVIIDCRYSKSTFGAYKEILTRQPDSICLTVHFLEACLW